MAKFAAVPVARLIEVPADISDETACQISLNPSPPGGCSIKPRLPQAIGYCSPPRASTVSNLVAAMALSRGIRIMGIVRGDAGDGAARSVAEHVFSVKDPAITRKIVDVMGEPRVEVLLDSVGGPILQKLFAALGPGARESLPTGSKIESRLRSRDADLFKSYMERLRHYRWLSGLSAPATSAMRQELWSMIRDGALALSVDSIHKLTHFHAALRAECSTGT